MPSLYVVRALQLGLSLLMIATLYMSWQSLAYDAPMPGLPAVDATRARDARAEGPTEESYAIIARRALFVAVEEAPAPPPEPPPAPPVQETELDIRLLGTVFRGDPTDPGNRATIIDVDGEPASVQVNEVIADGKAVVERIEKERIVISQGDRREAVSLPKAPEAPQPELRGDAILETEDRILISVGPPNGKRRETRTRTAPSRADLSRARADRRPRTVSPVASATRAVRRAVELETQDDAVRIANVTAGGKAEELGFRAGDRVTAINGVEISGRSVPPGLVQSFIRGGDPVVSVEDASGSARQITIPREMLTEDEPGDD